MAKKPMTKSQIVSYFASKFVLPKKAASAIIEHYSRIDVLINCKRDLRGSVAVEPDGEIAECARFDRRLVDDCRDLGV